MQCLLKVIHREVEVEEAKDQVVCHGTMHQSLAQSIYGVSQCGGYWINHAVLEVALLVANVSKAAQKACQEVRLTIVVLRD